MPAPNRLRVIAGDLVVSAYILPEMANLGSDKPVCKTCAPRRTKMVKTCEVSVPRAHSWLVYAVYRCSFCMAQWAIPLEVVADGEVVK